MWRRDQYTPLVDDAAVPTGQLADVKGTALEAVYIVLSFSR